MQKQGILYSCGHGILKMQLSFLRMRLTGLKNGVLMVQYSWSVILGNILNTNIFF